MADKKITEAVERAEANAAIEAGPKDSKGSAAIKAALEKAKSNGSFFQELVNLYYQQSATTKDNGEDKNHGRL